MVRYENEAKVTGEEEGLLGEGAALLDICPLSWLQGTYKQERARQW